MVNPILPTAVRVLRRALTTVKPHTTAALLSTSQRTAISNYHPGFFSPSLTRSFSLTRESLPVLNELTTRIQQDPDRISLEKTAVVYIHHALGTSVDVVESLIALKAKPEHIFVLGKSYSQNDEVVQQMKDLKVHYKDCSKQVGLGGFSRYFISDINNLWAEVCAKLDQVGENIENVIIADHGGHAVASVPADILQNYNVVGIEKTTAGLKHPYTHALPFPLIEVASCTAKKVFESPLIAEALVSKLSPFIPLRNDNIACGVVGYGSIGKALAQKLLDLGHKVVVYDRDDRQLRDVPEGMIATNSLSGILSAADYIFGCTGTDITEDNIDAFRLCRTPKTLVSCSSEDVEFLSLLCNVQRRLNGKVAYTPLRDQIYETDFKTPITIVKGGFPANFDLSGESVPARDIQLTRALVLAGIYQAMKILGVLASGQNDARYNADKDAFTSHYMLDPRLQEMILKLFFLHRGEEGFKQLIDDHLNPKSMLKHSGGAKPAVNDSAQDLFKNHSTLFDHDAAPTKRLG